MIKQLVLSFPHGATHKQCDAIARLAQEIVEANVSEGGNTMTYMPITQEEEKHRGCEFAEDEMTYVFGYNRRTHEPKTT